MSHAPSTPAKRSRQLRWAGFLLGFALAGFFDGILLHQVLQWHHLLIELRSPPFQERSVQILADGLFHSLMYAVGLLGLWSLWRARREFAEPGADRLALAWGLAGFGVWHILDAVVVHWLLGLHHIRADSQNPLFWDLLWFFLFGVLFVAAGWRLQRGMRR